MKMTYAKYFQAWFEMYREPRVRNVTAVKYLMILDQLKESDLGKIELKKVERSDVQGFFNNYGKTRQRQTVLDVRMTLNASFLDAVHDGFIKINPCARVEVTSVEDQWSVSKRKKERDKKKWLEIDEYKRLKMYLIGLLHVSLRQDEKENLVMKNRKNEVVTTLTPRGWLPQMMLMVIYIALKTGARFSEIMGITKDDIDFDHATLNIDKTWDYKYGEKFVPTKNISSVRKIPIDQEFLIIMKQYIAWLEKHDIGIDSEAILVRDKTGVHNSTINKLMRNIFKAIDIEAVTVHKLRHTQASILIAQGISLQVIAKRLGHTDTHMIQKTYGHLLESVEEDENEKIMELI